MDALKMDAIEYTLNRVFMSCGGMSEKVKTDLTEIWDNVASIPTAKTGKYHPAICNVKPYGLINHVIRCVHFAEYLCTEEQLAACDIRDVMTALLFHDMGKYEFHVRPYNPFYDHGAHAAKWLEAKGYNERICRAVRNHMRHWERAHPKTIENDDIISRIVAYADYLASRQDVILSDELFIVPDGDYIKLVTEPEFLGVKNVSEDINLNVNIDNYEDWYSDIKSYESELEEKLKRIKKLTKEVEKKVTDNLDIGDSQTIGDWIITKTAVNKVFARDDAYDKLCEIFDEDTAQMLMKHIPEHYEPHNLTETKKLIKGLGLMEHTDKIFDIIGVTTTHRINVRRV